MTGRTFYLLFLSVCVAGLAVWALWFTLRSSS